MFLLISLNFWNIEKTIALNFDAGLDTSIGKAKYEYLRSSTSEN